MSRARATILTRVSKTNGQTTYTVYSPRDRDGRRLSLGTFANYEQAVSVRDRYNTATDKGSLAGESLLTLREYVDGPWRTLVDIEPTTRRGYLSYLNNHILPLIGHKKVRDITRSDILRMMDSLRAKGATKHTMNRCKMILSSVFSSLLDIEAIEQTPVVRIKAPRPAPPNKPVMLPEEVRDIFDNLPNKNARLFAHLLIETGVRYGEASELRKDDIDWRTGTVFVRRAVADVGDLDNPASTGRFYVKRTKGGRERITTVGKEVLALLSEHSSGMSPGDLLFPVSLVDPGYVEPRFRHEDVNLAEAEGLTEPNDRGYRYRHGTTSGYGPGGCRCDYCRAAVRQYRRSKRKRSTVAKTNLTGHMPREVWRRIWNEAVSSAGIQWTPTTHDMRHAHATWLLKSGVDLHTVKERLGHASITTTEQYLHRMRMEDDKISSVIGTMLG